MVRKIMPTDVRDDYLAQLAAIDAFHQKGLIAFTSDADESTLTEHSLLATAVAWEGFVSDMFIAYINRDSARFLTHMEQSFRQHLQGSGTPLRVFNNFGKLEMPSHLKKKEVMGLANSIGNNITFPNYSELESKAKTWLTAPHFAVFKDLLGPQKAVINLLISLRNHIAHRSQRSFDAMNESMLTQALYPTGLQRQANKIQNVGAWLKSKPVGRQEIRLAIILRELNVIGARF